MAHDHDVATLSQSFDQRFTAHRLCVSGSNRHEQTYGARQEVAPSHHATLKLHTTSCSGSVPFGRYFAFAAACIGVPSLISSVARRTTLSPGFKFPITSTRSPSVTP